MIIKTYKYKLKLNKTQESTLSQWLGVCRYVYNVAKEVRETSYKGKGISIGYFDLCKQLTEVRAEFDWVRDVPAQTLQDVLERQDRAFKAFFKKNAAYPKWASKRRYNSITFKSVKVNGKIKLPKIGSLRYYNSRNIPEGAKLQRATITRETDGWYICIMFRTDLIHLSSESQAVGLDWGVTHLATLSTGRQIANPRFGQKDQAKFRVLQRKLSRQKKFGSNWVKTKAKLSKLHRKIARRRNDYFHKTTTELVKKFAIIGVEELKVKNMTRSAKGNIEEPGKNVNAKSGLNRSILDAAPGMFLGQLEYKSNWYGKTFIKSNPHYSSQECNECGHTDKANRIDQSTFLCLACGHQDNADINAAKNIEARAMASSRERGALARA